MLALKSKREKPFDTVVSQFHRVMQILDLSQNLG
jgi:hypothetical protein